MNNDFRDYTYLAHHGIKGQKWGVRNGPPYPLNASAKSSNERKGKRSSGVRKSEDVKTKRSVGSYIPEKDIQKGKKAFDKEKALKVLKVAAIAGGVVVGTAVAANIIKHYDAGNILDYYANINDSDDMLDNFLYNATKKLSSDQKSNLLGQFKRLTPEESNNALKNMRKTNFGYPVFGRTMNCTFCTAAMAMREKGYDAMARITPGGFKPTDIFDRFFEGAQTKMTNAKSFDTELAKQGPGAYGNLAVYWKDAFGGGGHSLFYKVADNGKVKIYDGQNGMPVPVSLLKVMIEDGNLFSGKGTTNYCQLNNCNPIGDIFAIVQPR